MTATLPPAYAMDIFRRASQRIASFYEKLAPECVTLPQLTVLRVLFLNGTQTQTQIMAETSVDRSTLSEMLRRMARDGLVAAVRCEEDQRATLVTITPKGRKVFALGTTMLEHAEQAFFLKMPRPRVLGLLRELQICLEVADERRSRQG
jgi:DNA-binding MarR family transcriptional regulator